MWRLRVRRLFPKSGRRMAVAAAGMGMELLVASLALFLWLNIESGRVSTIAYNVMLIGGVSTILFNGNPLLRFDGYYILSDLDRNPHLAQRSTAISGTCCSATFLVLKSAFTSYRGRERPWLVIYGVAAFSTGCSFLGRWRFLSAASSFSLGLSSPCGRSFTQIVLPQ